MTNEELERGMNFLVEHQARLSTDIDKLVATVAQTSRVLKMALVAGRKVRSEFRQSQEELKEMREMLHAVIDSQMRTSNEMSELRGVMQQMAQAVIATNKRIDGLENGGARSEERQ